MNFRRVFLRLTGSAAMSFALFAAPSFAADLNTAPVGDVVADLSASAPARPSRERVRMSESVFDRVWEEVRSQYYDPGLHGVDWGDARRTYRPQALAAVDDRALYGVLGEMLALLDDDHAGASAPAVAHRQDMLRERRATIGVKLRADPANPDIYVVESVREGSPAEAAGIDAGWRLDTSRADAWHPELDIVEGRAVTLAFAGGEAGPREVSVTPVIMEPTEPFVVDRSHPGVVVLRVEGFEPGLGAWMGQQLAQLTPDTDVVIDLRGNPGGRLTEADAVLSCFLPRDRAWATRTTRAGRAVTLKTGGACGDLASPAVNDVAVLVDGNSRSAAELTPAALQEAGRAVVVGELTAGAVLISQETPLPDGGSLSLSRADFVTSGGVRLEKRGVTPDLAASAAPGDRRAGRDQALAVAIAALAQPKPELAASASVSAAP
jgi:carboxyl-terminal processing protease